ncbi:MAG: hypothetical protein SGCHY_002985 [Lobulomycetales sp.]
MADHLASIYGTEKDKVNCSFYYKIGACRHGDRCRYPSPALMPASRKHMKPTFSQTIKICSVYRNPMHSTMAHQYSPDQLQEHFDLFFEDMFLEIAKFGEIEELKICDNVGDHLIGNVYVRFANEDDAQRAVDSLNTRFYAAKPLHAELSPVTDFRESCCRQYEERGCDRKGFCNFMHLKKPNRQLERDLFAGQRLTLDELKNSAPPPPAAPEEREAKRVKV